MYMKNYLKPYTACTKVEMESHLLSGSGSGGGYNGRFLNQVAEKLLVLLTTLLLGQTKDSWGSVKAGTPSPAAKEELLHQILKINVLTLTDN